MNKTKTTIPLLTLLTAALSYGLYISTAPPAVALELTWNPPTVDECYVAADGYIVQVEADGAVVELDTVFTNAYEFLPAPGTYRFRVLGFALNEDGTFRLGRMADESCIVLGDTAWSVWSDAVTTLGVPGVTPKPSIAVGVK